MCSTTKLHIFLAQIPNYIFDQNPSFLPHLLHLFLVKFHFSLQKFGAKSQNFNIF